MSGLSFMNEYHTKDTDENSIKDTDFLKMINNFKEHTTDYPDPEKIQQYYSNLYKGKTKQQIDAMRSAKLDFNKDTFLFSDNDMSNLIGYDILSSSEDMLHNRFNKFSRYGYLDPAHEMVTGTREYLFFSKPDLHLINVDNYREMYNVLSFEPFFKEAFERYKLSYYSLQQTFNVKGEKDFNGINIDFDTKYIPLLSNMVTSTFDLPDINAGDVLNNQNIHQVNTSYREGSITSDLQYDFSLEFKDTKYLDVYMLFKIYDEYFRIKYMSSDIIPTKLEYIFNRIYPEALSIWKVIVDDTGRIIYWAKATGCTPMSVPRGSISNIEGNIKFTVNWKAQFIKDMDPVHLLELNYLTMKSLNINQYYNGSIARTILNNDNISAIPDTMRLQIGDNTEDVFRYNGPTWVGYPLIITNGTSPFRTGHHVNITESNIKEDSGGFHRLIWISKNEYIAKTLYNTNNKLYSNKGSGIINTVGVSPN